MGEEVWGEGRLVFLFLVCCFLPSLGICLFGVTVYSMGLGMVG